MGEDKIEKIELDKQIFQTPETKKDSDRLNLEELDECGEYGRIPYNVWYSFDCPADDDLNEKKPALYMITPNMTLDPRDKGESVGIFIHESVPVEFKDIVIFHELREIELRFTDNLEGEQAHKQAVVETKKYAKKHLSKKEFDRFIKWESTLEKKQV